MGFYKINYGNVDEEYGIVLYKQDANNLNFFISQVNNAIQENLKSLITNENLNNNDQTHSVEENVHIMH